MESHCCTSPADQNDSSMEEEKIEKVIEKTLR